jgi:hypothetical protein
LRATPWSTVRRARFVNVIAFRKPHRLVTGIGIFQRDRYHATRERIEFPVLDSSFTPTSIAPVGEQTDRGDALSRRFHRSPDGLLFALLSGMHIDQQPSLWRQASRSTGLPSLAAEEIAARAYTKYLARERVEGGAAVNDWLEAERELLHEKILNR